MQRTSQLSVLSGFLLILLSSSGDTYNFQSSSDSCHEAYGQTLPQFECSEGGQLGMNVCSLDEFYYYDSILNLRYSRLMHLLDLRLKEESGYDNTELNEYEHTLKYKDAIVEAQRNWLKMRIANEKVQKTLYEGGSMQPMAVNMQSTIDTKHRICFLDDLLHNEEH